MSKHTPGPWKVTDNGIRAHGGYIAHTNSVMRYPGQDDRYAFEVAQRDADKRLIAVAPDLLEQLEDMLSSLKVLGVSGLDAEIKNATAVVARAKGETVSAKEIPTPAHDCWFCDGTKEYQGEPCLICVEPKP